MDNVKKGLLEAIHTRRSTRQYRADPVPKELLEEVVEAGRMAPSGGNNQTTHFIVVTDPGKLAELREVVTGILANMPIKEGMVPQFVGIIKKAKEETVDIAYGAPALIFTANKKGYDNAIADCACALQNMMLTASAHGIGNCWINQFYLLREVPPLRSFMESLGLKADEEVCGALALGYAYKLETTPLPRNGNPVTYI